MSSGGGGTTTNTVQKSDPPAYLQPYLTDIAGQAQTQAQRPMSFFPGQTFANLSPETESALQFQTARAAIGSPLTAAAQGQLTSTLQGGYLDPSTNPAFQKGAQDIQARVGGLFSGAGRYGSGAHANQYREALTDLGAKTYESERQRQMQGTLLAPQLAQQDYYDASKLAEVGGVREDLSQQGINEAMQRFNFGQMEPWQRLQLYSNIVQGQNQGGTTEGSQSQRRALGFGDVVGGASSLGSLGLLGYLALSDRRAKTDIKRVGLLDDGLPVYTYRYKGDDEPRMGVMAQDVEKVKPDAVVEVGGVKMVNYGLLGA